jgi:hypothetical protein
MSQSSWIGHKLGGRYQIEELIGQGGMSTVYKATDPNLRRVVAVKLIHPHLSSNPEFVRRFGEEAAAVAQLSHPNIIQVFDFDNEGSTYYMVLAFLVGETLQARLKRLNAANRRLSIGDTLEIMASICDAVDYAHRRGMIHRDIKPANIMLTNQGQAVLMDFGVVKMLGSTQHTATGAVIGTALYMSPEQARGEHPSERSDIYSLGVTLFEMVSGRPPFEADSALTAMMMHINDPVPNVLELNHETPQALKMVIEKALAKNPAVRYQTAGAMADALRGVLAQLRGAAPRATVAEEPSFVGGGTVLEDARGMGADTGRTWMDQSQMDVTPRPTPPAARPPTATGVRTRRPQKRSTSSFARKGLPLIAIVGGAGLLFAVVAAVIVGALLLSGGGLLAGSPPDEGGSAGGDTGENAIGDTGGEEGAAAVAFEQTATPTPAEAPTLAPTDPPLPTETPTSAYTPTLAYTPTPTVPSGIPYVRIDDITLDGNVYVVTYEAFEYEPVLPGMHIHFYFNTVSADNAGVPGAGPWYLYGGPNPFRGYTVADRPQGATQMCALVANPDHSIQYDSGNCFDLPE